jgi:hypothetical protein
MRDAEIIISTTGAGLGKKKLIANGDDRGRRRREREIGCGRNASLGDLDGADQSERGLLNTVQ